MKRVDAYLSRKLQEVYPTALVFCEYDAGKETWTMRRDSEADWILGASFQEAKAAVDVVIKAEKATQ